MARLPQPGGDNGNWGSILNEYLSQSLKPDGALKDNVVTEAKLASSVQSKLNAGSASPDWSAITNKPTVIAAGADQVAARTVIGAGTSNLVLGTTNTTAKAGDYQPASVNISDSTVIGRSLLTTTDANTARGAIGADRQRSQTWVVFGDSLTEQGGEIPVGDTYGIANSAPGAPRNNPDTRAFAAWTWANVLLNQAFTTLANYGIGGQTTSQILARVNDAIALNPGWVILTAGTNNMGVAGGLAQAKADITAILNQFAATGIRVALLTLPPRLSGNYTGTIKSDTLALNEWIRQQARTYPGIVVADVFPALADGGASNYLTNIYGFNPTTDGVHLSATGAYACGKVLAEALRPFITTNAVPYSNPNPGANLLTTATGRPAGTGSSAATGWNATNSPTWSDVARVDGLGSWKQVVIASGNSILTTNATVDGTRLAIGDTINGIIEFDASAMEQAAAVDAQGIMVELKAWNGTSYFDHRYAFNYFRGPNVAHSGVIRVPDYVVPATTTIVTLAIELRGAMTFKFDRPGVYARKTYSV